MMPGVETHWPAPAKLNLFLHVTGRRADGYHELQTLFQLIDLADTVPIAVREDGLIERPAGPAGVRPGDGPQRCAPPGLCSRRPASALGATLGVSKRIPMGGGLGGGSSDAATVLLALNELWGCDLPLAELARTRPAAGRGCACFRSGFFGLGGRGGREARPAWTCPSAGTW